jgi:hypothetical protein
MIVFDGDIEGGLDSALFDPVVELTCVVKWRRAEPEGHTSTVGRSEDIRLRTTEADHALDSASEASEPNTEPLKACDIYLLWHMYDLMKTVDVSYVVGVSHEALRDALSPRDIVEYANIYEIQSAQHNEITVAFEDEIMVFEFSEIEDGYEYVLAESTGLFAERETKMTVRDSAETDDGETEVVAVRQGGLDSRWALFLDWLMADTVEQELETMVENLVSEAMDATSASE